LFLKYLEHIKNNEIILSNKLTCGNNIIYRKILLHIGCWKRELSVKYMDNWPVDALGLPKDLSKDFVLPDSITYKIRFEDRNIYVGPIIGLLFVTKHKALTPEFLSAYKCYLLSYNEVKGLIFIGSSEGINIENQTMKGYLYRPAPDESWVEGIFPYPDALYRRIGLPDIKYQDLIMHMGDRIFNTYFFNKWELWQYISPYEKIKPHLPHTEKLTDANALAKILEQYDSVYLKKILGERSMGIYKVTKVNNEYQFIDNMSRKYIFTSIEEISEFIQEINKRNGSYLVQQAIKVKNFEGRNFDMRVILQKDENMEWSLSGIIARFGAIGNITSVGLNRIAMHGIDAIKKAFNMTEEEAKLKEKEIVSVCSEICDILNKSIGNYGDLGIDVIIDENQKIWILEINKLHYHRYPVYALNDWQMYLDITSKPLKYAGGLSGF
jgi:hypothetical protein